MEVCAAYVCAKDEMLVGLIALYAGPCVQLPQLTAHVSLSVLLTLRNDQSAFGNIFAFFLHRRRSELKLISIQDTAKVKRE